MTPQSESTVFTWRRALGASGRLWQGPSGRHISQPGWAMTYSGETGIDHNVAICHAPGPDAIGEALAALLDTGSPGLIMLGGRALGEARTLAQAGWVPVSSVPFMACPIAERRPSPDVAVRRLDMVGLDALRSIVGDVYELSPSLARLAIPDAAAVDAHHPDPAFAAWGLFEDGQLVTGTGAVVADSIVCIWSLATLRAQQQRGYGRRLLSGMLADYATRGETTCLLLSRPMGEALYRSLGFEIVEHWQVWSRPRWVLA